jgi:hypothetical protein
MDTFTPAEKKMWADMPAEESRANSDVEINAKYGKRELRIVTETNREQLPNFVAALKRPDWLKLQPFYQRRKRWDDKRKSKLIESFIMNIPVPPCFLFESDFARYEVMDGQQRISAIWDFYNNNFKLKGLKQWPDLNGRIYDKLPGEIKKGLDRRSISYIVLLKESATSTDEEILLRQQVFERLNTGGVELENQEIRHCIYHNKFDEALVEMAKHPAMRKAWNLPEYSTDEDTNPSDYLLANLHFSKMKDVEFILRFFALRHAEQYRGGMQNFLNQYMIRSRRFSEGDVEDLENIFVDTIEFGQQIYLDNLFKPWIQKTGKWSKQPQFAYADAVLVGLSKFREQKERLIELREEVVEASMQLVINQPVGTFTGQGNTKKSIVARIQAYEEMISAILK